MLTKKYIRFFKKFFQLDHFRSFSLLAFLPISSNKGASFGFFVLLSFKRFVVAISKIEGVVGVDTKFLIDIKNFLMLISITPNYNVIVKKYQCLCNNIII